MADQLLCSDAELQGGAPGWQACSSRCQGFLPPVNEFPGGAGSNLSLSRGVETRPCLVAKGFYSHEHCQCDTHYNYVILHIAYFNMNMMVHILGIKC